MTSDEEEFATTPVKKPRLDDAATDATNVIGELKGPRKNQQFSPLNIQYENSSTSSAESGHEKSNGKIKLSPSFKRIINTSPIVKLKKISNSDKELPSRRYPKRNRRPPANILGLEDTTSRTSSTTPAKDKQEKKDKKKPVQLQDMYDWSECKVSLEHDKKYNFFPEAGPSHINYYENVSLPGYYAPRSMDDTMTADNQSEYDIHIQSLYDASMLQHSPMSQNGHSPNPFFNISDPDDPEPTYSSPFQISTPLLHSIKANFQTSSNRPRNRHEYIAAPVTITPTAGAVLSDLINYDLPQVVSKSPFYSNCDDVANIREVGNHILQIPNLADCETFESSLISTGLNAWRRSIYTNIMSMDDKEKLQNKSLQEIREFFAVQKRIIIIPNRTPPTVNQAELWLQRDGKEDRKEEVDIDNDSPIKIKREKAKIILENGGGGGADDEEYNECDVSLSCSPIAVLTKSQDLKLVNKHLTKVSKRSVKAKKSLNSTFDELKSNNLRESPSMFSDFGESESPTNDVHDSDEEIPSSQVITIKRLRSKNDHHMNGHTETNTSNCMSDSSPLVNSVS